MPTTVVGLIIFIVGLAPGLTYNTYRSASRPVDKPTALREVGSITLQSVTWDIVTLAVFGILRICIPNHTPDLGRLLRDPTPYLRADGPYLFWWGVGLLSLACSLGLAAAVATSTSSLQDGVLKFLGPRGPVAAANSAWWTLFKVKAAPDTKTIMIGVLLDDGTYLAGELLTFSPDSTESADRELSLKGPITQMGPTATTEVDLGVGAVIVSARHIQYMTVSYLE